MILSNQAKCKACGDTPYSAHRHDYRSCKCGKIQVDGGMSYIRRGFQKTPDDFIELSIDMDDDLVEKLRARIDDKTDNKNSLGKLCQIMILLRDAGYPLNRPETAPTA